MRSNKGMVQWATGTKPQRFNRSDGTYQAAMEALTERVEEAKRTKKTPKPIHRTGQVVLCGENVEIVQEVDALGSWVNIRGHKHSVDYCRAVPEWFTEAYEKLLKEMNNGN